METSAPLCGLILSGGHSKRMHRDKAALLINGETQLARGYRLLQSVCTEVFISVRRDQRDDAARSLYPQIVDQLDDIGPAAGILAALESRPDHPWLVVAVDLPLLDEATLGRLVQSRDASQLATAYRSSHDGLPEPLCAIWEPASRIPLEAFVMGGRSCPRKFLLNHPARLIELAAPNALANVNTPEELATTLAMAGNRDPS